MMNLPAHSPFRDWLFSEEPLTPDQVQDLQAHLRTCESCRRQQAAWAGVANLFDHTGAVTPLAGFANRWQSRLVARQDELRLARQRNLAWGLFAAAGLLAALMLGILFWQVWGWFGSTAGFWSQLTIVSGWLLNLAEQTLGFAYVMLLWLPPFNFWVVFFSLGFTCLLGALWVVVYQELSLRRVVVYETSHF